MTVTAFGKARSKLSSRRMARPQRVQRSVSRRLRCASTGAPLRPALSWLAVMAVMRKTSRAIQFWGSST